YARRGDQEHGAGGDGVEAKTGARDVKIVVSDVGTVSGRVLRDGKPVPQFAIYLRDTDQYLMSPTSVHSADGRFTLRGVAAGSWNFAIAGAGFGRTDIEHVAVRGGQDNDLGDIAVSKGREVQGRVTDSDGHPVAG